MGQAAALSQALGCFEPLRETGADFHLPVLLMCRPFTVFTHVMFTFSSIMVNQSFANGALSYAFFASINTRRVSRFLARLFQQVAAAQDDVALSPL
jgi:hypothetical protein